MEPPSVGPAKSSSSDPIKEVEGVVGFEEELKVEESSLIEGVVKAKFEQDGDLLLLLLE